MFKWIRSVLTRSPNSDGSLKDFDVIKSDVERILKLDLASSQSREEHRELVSNTLRELDSEIEKIRDKSNGYPANPISALVWMNGAGYGNLASALTHHFQTAGWLEREENASALWAKVTLAVCSHYHHMVGPAMLANADCHDRLGNKERATQMCVSVVKDFVFLAEDWTVDSEPPSDEDRLALESLGTALQRLIDRGVYRVDGIDLCSLKSQTASVLSRSIPDGNK